MSPLEEAVQTVRPWVDLFYLVSLLWIVLIWLRIPWIPLHWGGVQQSFFFSMLLMAVSTFPISWWLSEKFLNETALQDADFVAQRIRTGALIMAAMGEACAVYGYALYCVSGDLKRPWIFIFLTLLHYLFTRYRLEQTQ